MLHESSKEICLSFFCLRSGVAVWGSVNALKMCCTDRILNLMHLSRRVIKDFWQYLKSSTEWCSGVLKDCHRFDVFRENRCCPCGSYKWRWPKWMCLYEIRSQLSALVVIKHHLTNTLFDTPFWWNIQPCHVCRVSALSCFHLIANCLSFQNASCNGTHGWPLPCMIKHTSPHTATFTWSHVMWGSNIRQNRSLCLTVPSRTVFKRQPHYTTNKQKEAWSGLCHHSVPAISW